MELLIELFIVRSCIKKIHTYNIEKIHTDNTAFKVLSVGMVLYGGNLANTLRRRSNQDLLTYSFCTYTAIHISFKICYIYRENVFSIEDRAFTDTDHMDIGINSTW